MNKLVLIVCFFFCTLLLASEYDEAMAGCTNGDLVECVMAGQMLALGDGVEQNYEKANNIFKPICEAKKNICGSFGDIFVRIRSGETLPMALFFYKKACLAGEGKECIKLGQAYEAGYAEKTKKEEIEYIDLACKEGHSESCLRAGHGLYYGKDGYKKNRKKSFNLFDRACSLKLAKGCSSLAVMYINGDEEGGVSQNIEKAKNLFEQSCSDGDVFGCRSYKEVLEKTVGSKSNNSLLGKRVCNTWSDGENGWCGDITEILGDSIRVENYKVFCGSGGFLGICTNISVGGIRLFTDDSGENYKNPRSIVTPISSID